AGDCKFLDLALRGEGIEGIQHDPLQNHAQAARSYLQFYCLAGNGFYSRIRVDQSNAVKFEDGLILFEKRVLWTCQDLDKRRFIQFVKSANDRKTAHKL